MIKQVSKEIATPRSVTASYGSAENDKRYEQLNGAVRDLAAGQRDLHQRLEALVSVVAAIRDGDNSAADHPQPILNPRLALAPQAARRSWRAQVKRVARFVLRHTLGTVRRVWEAASPNPSWADQVILRVSGVAIKLPRLAVVQIVDENKGGEKALDTDEIRRALRRQTDTEFDCVVWHPGNGACLHERVSGEVVRANHTAASQLARALDVDYIWTLPPNVSDLPATFIETGRLLLGSEPLPFVRFECSEEPQNGALLWAIPDLWRGDGALDLGALGSLAKRSPEHFLGKVVGRSGGYSLAPEESLEARNGDVARRVGPYFATAGGPPRIFDHQLATLAECARARPSQCKSSVLLLVDADLAGGVEETVATLADIFGGLSGLLVVNLAAPDDLSARRWRQLARLVPRVYSLPELFAAEIFEEVLAYLIDVHKVHHLLYIGGDARTGRVERSRLETLQLKSLRRRFPAVQIVDSGQLPLGLDLTPFDPAIFTSDRIAKMRRDLRINMDAVLVTMVCDLIPSKRPEDFLALAHRCRDEERFVFLLMGEGSLVASLGDLNRCFGLSNLRLEPPGRTLAEVLAASDILCTTAESEPFPRTIVTALALGRPVVSPATGILPELLGDGPCGLVATEPGNLDDLEAAIRQLAPASRRRVLGENGPRVAAQFPGREALVETCRQVLGLPGSAGVSA